MKISGIVKSAKEITGTEGLKVFEGEINGKQYNYTRVMNDRAGQRIELEEYKGAYGYDYEEIKSSCIQHCWQASWLKDIQHETDWSKVPVDAKVIVKIASDKGSRYFAKFENGRVRTWSDGRTSWSAFNDEDTASWQPNDIELVE